MSEAPDRSDVEGPPEPQSRERRVARRLGYAVLVAIALVDAIALGGVGVASFRRQKEIASFRSPSVPSVGSTGSAASDSGLRKPRKCERPTLIGTVAVDQVTAHIAPDPKATVVATFDRKNALGTPHVFDLVQVLTVDGRRWYRALLPIRPNGTTGYINGKALRVAYTTYHLGLDRSKFRLTLYDACRKVRTFRVGIGTGSTPTPVGKFYLTGLFKPPDPTSVYGVSIYTLSGFSDVLTNWQLGGIIGLHGTNDPSSIGHNASHGCIRMRNPDILKLEKILPLGTPIAIT
jgi:hypothetical protein